MATNGMRAGRDELEGGIGVSKLAGLFGMSVENARRKLVGVKPIGEYNGHPLYHISDAAPRLCKPVVDIEDYVRRLRPQDLPPALSKDFWAAQRSRQQFEESAGGLWRTEKVQAALADLIKLFRQRVTLFTDTVDQKHALSIEQRQMLQALCDGLLDDTHDAVIEHFKNWNGAGDRDTVLEDGPPRPTAFDIDEEDDL